MPVKTDLLYPKDDYVELFENFYTGINGPASLEPVKQWQSDTWSYTVHCSRGTVLEKAGFALLHIAGGTIYKNPGSLKLFETLVYPANPRIPGFIFVVNLNETEALGKVVVYYIDLFIQDGRTHDEEKKVLSDSIKKIYDKHKRNFEERNAFIPGRILAGNAAECGLMNFFEEKDIPFLDELIQEALPAYRKILQMKKSEQPLKEDYEKMNQSRARVIEWITIEDTGVKIARDNGIPLEIIESYGFPPVVRY